jgi:hypothetical protein
MVISFQNFRHGQTKGSESKKKKEKTNCPEMERVPLRSLTSALEAPNGRPHPPHPVISSHWNLEVESLPSLVNVTATQQRLGGKGGG